jgi:hypothetical protein
MLSRVPYLMSRVRHGVWARPRVHVAKAAISQRVRIARCERAVLAVPVHVAFSKIFHCAPWGVAKSPGGWSVDAQYGR